MPDRDYFFVVGCPRSGTTLLSVLLDRHSRLCVTPETGFFDEIAPQLRWWWRSDRRLRDVLERWRRLPELGLTPEIVLSRLSGAWNRADVLAAILDSYAEKAAKARCGEKTPQHLRHVPAILAHYPKARILCMLRDGRDNALSLSAMPWFQDGLHGAAKLWRRYIRLMERHARDYPSRFLIVRYEELAAHPASSLARVMEFLDETIEPQQLSPDIPSGVVLPRSLAWKGDALRPPDPNAIARRRSNAAPDEMAWLERALRSELLRLGYT